MHMKNLRIVLASSRRQLLRVLLIAHCRSSADSHRSFSGQHLQPLQASPCSSQVPWPRPLRPHLQYCCHSNRSVTVSFFSSAFAKPLRPHLQFRCSLKSISVTVSFFLPWPICRFTGSSQGLCARISNFASPILLFLQDRSSRKVRPISVTVTSFFSSALAKASAPASSISHRLVLLKCLGQGLCARISNFVFTQVDDSHRLVLLKCLGQGLCARSILFSVKSISVTVGSSQVPWPRPLRPHLQYRLVQ